MQWPSTTWLHVLTISYKQFDSGNILYGDRWHSRSKTNNLNWRWEKNQYVNDLKKHAEVKSNLASWKDVVQLHRLASNRISLNSFWGVSPRSGTAAKPGWECGNMWAQCELKNLGCEQRLFTVFFFLWVGGGGRWLMIRDHFSSWFGIDQISLT